MKKTNGKILSFPSAKLPPKSFHIERTISYGVAHPLYAINDSFFERLVNGAVNTLKREVQTLWNDVVETAVKAKQACGTIRSMLLDDLSELEEIQYYDRLEYLDESIKPEAVTAEVPRYSRSFTLNEPATACLAKARVRRHSRLIEKTMNEQFEVARIKSEIEQMQGWFEEFGRSGSLICTEEQHSTAGGTTCESADCSQATSRLAG